MLGDLLDDIDELRDSAEEGKNREEKRRKMGRCQ